MGTISTLLEMNKILTKQNENLQALVKILNGDLNSYRDTIKAILDMHVAKINGIDVVAMKDLADVISRGLSNLERKEGNV